MLCQLHCKLLTSCLPKNMLKRERELWQTPFKLNKKDTRVTSDCKQIFDHCRDVARAPTNIQVGELCNNS